MSVVLNPFTGKFDFTSATTQFMSGTVVQATDYGVVADGVTDDKTALDNAWNAVAALPTGGILQLPAGTIYLATKWAPTAPGSGKGIWLRGAGRWITVFKFDTTVGNNSYIIKFAGTSASVRYAGRITLSDFSFDNSAWGLDGVQRINSGTVAAVTSSTVTLGSAASGTSSFYDGSTFVIVADSVNPLSVGQVYSMTGAYVGGTKVLTVGSWGSGRQPSTSARYGILLNSTDADDQPIRGCGRILFSYCDYPTLKNLGTYGGHGWIDIRGTDYGKADDLFSLNVSENSFNFLGGTGDGSTDPNPRYWTVNNVTFYDTGEGFDMAVDDASIDNSYIKLQGYDDEAFDLNSSHRVSITNAVTYGGAHSINFHGVTYDNDSGYGSSRDVRISNVVAKDFGVSGFAIYYGTAADKWRVELGPATAGTFSLTFGGNTASGIAYNATTSDVQSALNALGSVIAAGSVTVTGNTGGPYLIAFGDGVGGSLTGSGTGLTGADFQVYNAKQRSTAGQVCNLSIDHSSFVSSVAGAKGIETSWVNTSYPVRVDDISVSHCYVDVDGTAISAQYNKNLLVTDSTFRSASSYAAYGLNSTNLRGENVIFERCRFKGVGANTTVGVCDFAYQQRPRFEDCEWEWGQGQGYAARFLNCVGTEFLRNRIYDAAHHGIYFDWSTAATVESDNDLRTSIIGNRIYQFGTQASTRFGITVTGTKALNANGVIVKDNYVNYTVTYDVTTGGASAGTFTLTFNSATTPAIAYNATATEVEVALENLGTIGWGSLDTKNVRVKGAAGGPWYVEFIGELYGTALALSGSGAGLTGGAFAVNSHTASRAYSLAWTSSQTLDLDFSDNAATDRFTATQKVVFTNIADSSKLNGNKLGTTFGSGVSLSVGDWYQINVPASQSATEATWGGCQPMQTRANTAQAGAAGSITLDASASAVDDAYNGWLVITTGGTGANQTRAVSDYVGSTKVASVTPNWGTNPDNTTTFLVYQPSVNEAYFSAKRWIARKPGSFTRVWVKTSAAVTAGTLTVTAYKNGSTTGFACTVTSGTTGYAIQPSGQDTFVQGDALSIYVTTDGSFAPADSMEIRAGFDVEY